MTEIFTDRFGDAVLETGEYRGIRYAVVMGPMSINGYVKLPDEHPQRDAQWGDFDAFGHLRVHYGISYVHDGVIGFDTNHYGDAPHPDARLMKENPDGYGSDWGGHVWTQSEVLMETIALANQVAGPPNE